jgi:hypothetical protein
MAWFLLYPLPKARSPVPKIEKRMARNMDRATLKTKPATQKPQPKFNPSVKVRLFLLTFSSLISITSYYDLTRYKRDNVQNSISFPTLVPKHNLIVAKSGNFFPTRIKQMPTFPGICPYRPPTTKTLTTALICMNLVGKYTTALTGRQFKGGKPEILTWIICI